MDEDVMRLQGAAMSVGTVLYYLSLVTLGLALQLVAAALRAPEGPALFSIVACVLLGVGVPMMLVSCGMRLRKAARRVPRS